MVQKYENNFWIPLTFLKIIYYFCDTLIQPY